MPMSTLRPVLQALVGLFLLALGVDRIKHGRIGTSDFGFRRADDPRGFWILVGLDLVAGVLFITAAAFALKARVASG